MENIGRFYTFYGEWGKETVKAKEKNITGWMNDPVKVIMFFKYFKLSIFFSLLFLTHKVQKFKCKSKDLWNWMRCL